MTGQFQQPRSRFGEFARERREELGITVQELADAARISASHLSKIERNLISPSYVVVMAICRSLKLDILELNQQVRYSREIDDRLLDVLDLPALPPDIAHEFLSLSLAARETLVRRFGHDR